MKSRAGAVVLAALIGLACSSDRSKVGNAAAGGSSGVGGGAGDGGLGGDAGAAGGAGTSGDGSGGDGGAAGSGGAPGTGGVAGSGGSGATAGSGGSGPVGGCGDGAAQAGEACDDGNQTDGDGCAADCSLESGFVCSAKVCDAAGACTWRVPATYRDFNPAGSAGGHPDFQPPLTRQEATVGLVLSQLDAERKPVFSGATGGNIQSVASFEQWYRDVAGVNARTDGALVLFHEPNNGTYVNRWNDAGERWRGFPNIGVLGDVMFCSASLGCDDPMCVMQVDPAQGRECMSPCEPWGQAGVGQACTATVGYFDGDPTFFPIDGSTNVIEGARYTATIPPAYGFNYSDEPGGALHNFHFTSEIRLKFRFRVDASLTLLLTGDDDVWVFVNGQLALDLGGWHPPLHGEVRVGGGGETYGLADGQIYEVAVFHADRQLDGSTFRLAVTDLEPLPGCARVE